MDTVLLATKLRIPSYPHRAVHRSRLIDVLQRGIPDHKLVQISAAAGYGKTTLLAQWAHVSRFPIAWLSVDEDDNDLERFLRYLLAAWERVQPSVRESPFSLLLGGMSPSSQAVLSAFINVANDVLDHLVFVLDDYHLIDDPSIHQALTFLLDHLPPMLHFVLAGRAEPPLPLARYRAKGELLELRAEDLRFLQQETTDFLNELMELDLSHDHVVRLQTQLDGWAAGLQLVALNLQHRLTGTDTHVVSGRQRFIVAAGDLRFAAENVVVAISSWQRPKVPDFAQELDPHIVQLHSGAYLNPSQLQEGGVLIVGAGNLSRRLREVGSQCLGRIGTRCRWRWGCPAVVASLA